MAASFNGTTSKLEHTTATGFNVATLTIVAWIYANGQGENSFGRVFQADEVGGGATNGFFLSHNNAANQLLFAYAWSAGANQGSWSFPATDSQWNAVAVTYDRGSTANDPTARVNFASASTTELNAPSGSAVAVTSGYCIGNRSAQDRTWDGRIAHLQFFDVLLADEEIDAALRWPGRIRRGLVAWWPLYHATYLADLVGGTIPTATGLSTADGPPTPTLWPGRSGWAGTTAAPVAPGWGPLLAGHRNRLVVAR